MNKIASIFTFRFFDFEKNQVRIGGIETYTNDLAQLFVQLGYDTTIYIPIDSDENYKSSLYKGIKVQEIAKEGSFDKSFKKKYYQLGGKGIYLVMTDDMEVNSSNFKNVITIQHGICWDSPSWAFSKKCQNRIIYPLMKLWNCYSHISIFKKASNMVCVDYNYYNWIRTLHEIPEEMNLSIIPNYSSSKMSQKEFDEKISLVDNREKAKIVFARRFTRYRGAQLFANVAKRLITKYPGLDITFAGEGDLKQKLVSEFKDYDNVHITHYNSESSVEFHKQFDIAVVPTIYSEGTSLSLCEAMSAGCLPVATHVGGLTNLLIDSFNGKLCYPNEDSVFNAIEELILMPIEDYKILLRNSYNSSTIAFSKEKWQLRWENFITMVSKYID